MKRFFIAVNAILILFLGANIASADVDSDLARLQQRWSEVNYQIEGKAKLMAFEQLVEQAERLTLANPDSAEAWTWSGIVKSTFAGARGGLGALGLAKAAKADLEKAMGINAEVLNGSAMTSLGTLYHSVPGWPVGFGNEDKAAELLIRGVELNPENIDTNYFYGTFLMDTKQYTKAKEHLLRAQQAQPRPNREIADAGRQKEVAAALAALEGKL